MNYNTVVETVNNLLKDNNEKWQSRYKDFADKVIKHEKEYTIRKKRFQVKMPLYCYTEIGSLLKNPLNKKTDKENKLEYKLRFYGQDIATVSVQDENILISTKKYDKSNEKLGNKPLGNNKWSDKETSEFLAKFKQISKEKVKSKEHRVENILLAEFAKKKSEGKKLCNIQPIKLCGLFFQFTTPLRASKEIGYSENNKGGGIDILARVKHKNNSVNICVMELKDENIEKENPKIAMKQAVTYAAFVAHLLRSESGNDWYKIFGFGKDVPKELTIDVAIVMPFKEERSENFEKLKEIKVLENTYLKLYSLYFLEDEKGFIGSLKDSMLPHK